MNGSNFKKYIIYSFLTLAMVRGGIRYFKIFNANTRAYFDTRA